MTEPKFQDLGAWLESRPVSSLVDRMREEPSTMTNLTTCPVCAYVRDAAIASCYECQGIDVITPLTLTDAKHETTVRRALESALVSGVASPELDFGPIYVRMTTSGYWVVIAPRLVETHVKTTDQAIALIVATARNGRN